MESSAQLDSISTDLNELTDFIKSTNHVREWKKAEAVKLTIQGFYYRAISQRLQISYSSIARIKKKYKAREVSGLKFQYKGSLSYLTEVQKADLKNWLFKKP